MTGLTPSPSEVDTPSDNKADEEEDVGEPVGHHERCFIPRISLCDLMDLFRFFILFLCHGCVKSFVQFMLSTRSLGCSANILGPNQGIYIHLYSPQVSPFKRGRRLDFCWVGSTLMKRRYWSKALFIGLNGRKLCLLHQCFSRYSQKVSLGFILKPPTFGKF